MEQDEYLFEYRMGRRGYRFEARNIGEAKAYREYALLYFQENLGVNYLERSLAGPFLVDFQTQTAAA